MNSFKLKMDVFELAAAAAGGYLVLFFDKYLAPNGLFALALMLLVAADTVSGVAASIKEKTFSSKEMARPLRKIAIYMLTLLPLHVLADALPPGPVKEIINTGDGLAYAYICVRELVSIQENTTKLGHPVFPPKWAEKIRKLFEK